VSHRRINRAIWKQIRPRQQSTGHGLEALPENREIGASPRRRVAEIDEHRYDPFSPPIARKEATVVVLFEPLTGPVPSHLPRLEVIYGHSEVSRQAVLNCA
jgi:hypothetical protein